MNKPPWMAKKLLDGFIKYEEEFNIVDTLQELYCHKHETEGKLKADFWYWKQVLHSIPKNLLTRLIWGFIMIQNYFKITFRNLKKYKAYSFINIAGLALGFTCSLFILAYIQNEMIYDRFHKDTKKIYQVLYHSGQRNISVTPLLLAPELEEKCPEVVDAARFHWIFGETILSFGDKTFNESRLRLADPSFLDIFSFPLIKGDPKSALSSPYSIVISEEIAEKYFGNEEPLGKVFTLNHEHRLTVTGVMNNIPRNSTLRFDMLVPFEFNILTIGDPGLYKAWSTQVVYTFLKCRDDLNVEDLNEKMTGILRQKTEGKYKTLTLLPLKDRYFQFYSERTTVYALIFVAVVVLLIACFNFLNLSTARAGKRAKEIGMRKIAGAHRKQLVFQFLGESVFLSILAAFASITLFAVLLPVFNSSTGIGVLFQSSFVLLSSLGISLSTGFFAGIYPAFFLSNYKVINVLRGRLSFGQRGSGLRKSIVVTQFVLSIFLIFCMLVVNKQINFVQNKDFGYERKNVVSIPMGGGSEALYPVFKDELLKNPNILGVTGTSLALPFFHFTTKMEWEGMDPERQISINFNEVDYDFVKTLKINLVAGRDFSRDIGSDERKFLINEKMAKVMGIESAVGATLKLGDQPKQIVGVMENFHFHSLSNQIGPLALRLRSRTTNIDNVLIRIQPGDVSSTLSFIEKTWKDIVPQYPFQYSFLEEDYDRSLFSLKRTGYLLTVFSFFAIFVSCLGLFGLSSYAAELRTKEIGIRKVLGASVPWIIKYISKEFILLVGMANILVWPMAYFVMDKWLQSYAYRINISIWTFLLSASLVLSAAVLTVSFQSIKAATANPVDSLRYE